LKGDERKVAKITIKDIIMAIIFSVVFFSMVCLGIISSYIAFIHEDYEMFAFWSVITIIGILISKYLKKALQI
jgi:hypothetical protein